MKELISNPIFQSLDFIKTKSNSAKSLSNGNVGEIIAPVLNKSIISILKGEVSKNTIHDQDAFFVANLASVVSQYKKWSNLLPRVTPFYG